MRAMKLINMSLAKEIIRYQGVTNFDTNAGWFPLVNRGETNSIGGENVKLPLNGIDLTTFHLNKNGATNPAKLYAHWGVGWNSTSVDAGIYLQPLQGQNPTASAYVLKWIKERAADISAVSRA